MLLILGYHDSEMEGFDRLSTCSSGHVLFEFERLSTALYNSRSRILEKVCTDPLPLRSICAPSAIYCHTGETASTMKMTSQQNQFVIEKNTPIR